MFHSNGEVTKSGAFSRYGRTGTCTEFKVTFVAVHHSDTQPQSMRVWHAHTRKTKSTYIINEQKQRKPSRESEARSIMSLLHRMSRKVLQSTGIPTSCREERRCVMSTAPISHLVPRPVRTAAAPDIPIPPAASMMTLRLQAVCNQDKNCCCRPSTRPV